MSGDITIEMKRYNPEKDNSPHFQTFRISYKSHMVVLDALNFIKNKMDGSLSFRWSCRSGICGSCGALVNGKPVLTCETFLNQYENHKIRVEPLRNFPVIKDLVIDIDDFMNKMRTIMPYIEYSKEKSISDGENLLTPDEEEKFEQSSQCIKCMLCYSACPVYGIDHKFIGPAASALVYRYNQDKRDNSKEERLEKVLNKDGIWNCSFIGECSVVCPKNVDPSFAIQKLKTMGALHTTKNLVKRKHVENHV